ncbi:MAG: hypothetical protein L0387_35790 [Acidobacteria bacterium]|nr:hypothetical protein [Acidobacteriota bacterium]
MTRIDRGFGDHVDREVRVPQSPPALTKISHSIVPAAVSTRLDPPALRDTPVAGVLR